MIDYRAHVAAFDEFRNSLAAETSTNPKVQSARDQDLSDLALAPDMALLGSLVDHLMWHASTDGRELTLLERAAALWQEGLELYNSMAEIRAGIESALADPTNPTSPEKFNSATVQCQDAAQNLLGKRAAIGALRADIETFTHLPPHPRELDKPLNEWSWHDVFLARRTDAFARAVRKRATDTATSAFALGVISGYGANACGSAYVNQVIGGPRRAHRHRERLARNTVGSWFAATLPGMPPLSKIAEQIHYGRPSAPTLPASIESLITDALSDTYDLHNTPSLPNLQLGYERMIHHISLLSTFAIPKAPPLPMEPFLSRIYGDLSNPYTPLVPQNVGVSGTSSGSGSGSGSLPPSAPAAGGSASGKTDSPPSTGDRCGAFWEGLMAGLTTLLGGWIPCWVCCWGKKEDCKIWETFKDDWDTAFSKPGGGAVVSTEPTSVTASQLTEGASLAQVTQAVSVLYDQQCLLWEALQKAYDFLVVYGLIYPDGFVDRPRQQQFVTVPAIAPGTFPHRPFSETEAADQLHLYPFTGFEQPAVDDRAYPTGAAPSVFIVRTPGTGMTIASDVSLNLWRQIAAGELDSFNLDLDADRGPQHPCWQALGSINDDPLNVRILPYPET